MYPKDTTIQFYNIRISA